MAHARATDTPCQPQVTHCTSYELTDSSQGAKAQDDRDQHSCSWDTQFPTAPSAGSHNPSLPNGNRGRWVQLWLLPSTATWRWNTKPGRLTAEEQPAPQVKINPTLAKSQGPDLLDQWFSIFRVGQRCLRSHQGGEGGEQPPRPAPALAEQFCFYLSYVLLFYLQLYLNKYFCCYICRCKHAYILFQLDLLL